MGCREERAKSGRSVRSFLIALAIDNRYLDHGVLWEIRRGHMLDVFWRQDGPDLLNRVDMNMRKKKVE